jgi:hypothetical protein
MEAPNVSGLFCCFVAVLGFEHRASCLCSISEGMPATLSAFGYFSDKISHFFAWASFNLHLLSSLQM